jgi:hypothetical protein
MYMMRDDQSGMEENPISLTDYPYSVRGTGHNSYSDFSVGKVVVIFPEDAEREDAYVAHDDHHKVHNIGHVVGFCIEPTTREILVNIRLATGLIEAFNIQHLYIP